MRKGEIWLVDLNGGVGSEQRGVRPCLVIQNDIGNSHSVTTIICPITRQVKHFSATHTVINCLKDTSYILCEQVRVIDKSRMIKYICNLDKTHMDEVEVKLMCAFGINKSA